QVTNVPVSGLQSQDVQAIHRFSPGSLSQAKGLVTNVTKDYQACQQAYAAVRHWAATKPQSQPIRSKKTGKIIGHTHPKIPPKPPVPAGCPPMPSSGTWPHERTSGTDHRGFTGDRQGDRGRVREGRRPRRCASQEVG